MEEKDSIQKRDIFSITETFKIAGVPLRKPCMCTAEDLVQASSYKEVEKLATQDVANGILSIMLDYESKLNHIFLQKKAPILIKERKAVAKKEETPQEIYSLKPIPVKDAVPVSFSLNSNFLDFLDFNFNTKPFSVMNFKLVHPLQSIQDFNGSISVIAHIFLSTQRTFSIKHKCVIIPYTSNVLFQYEGRKYRLSFSQSNPQTQELQDLSESLKMFVSYANDICNKAAQILDLKLPPTSPEMSEVSLDQLIASASIKGIDDRWHSAALALLIKAKFCAQCIQNCNQI